MIGEYFVTFLQQTVGVLTPVNLFLMVVGMVLGVLIGALPGLNATLSIALLTPITFSVPTDNALSVLLSLYIGVMFGGSISAILINIPGTGSAAATLIDGYPLAKKGLGANAIMVSRWASAIGTLLGVLFLLFFAPVLSLIAVNFGSAEYFWLGIMGILVCGSYSDPKAPYRGWIAGILGLLFSFIGIDDIHAYPRFTFGLSGLYTGVELIPALIGIFGIPTLISALNIRKELVTENLGNQDFKILGFIRKNILHIFRWAVIGVGIGALPGVGENVAAFMGYSDAKKRHPDRERFGTGEYAGVAAPETANNAAVGGAILPMLTLGIPGSPPAAVLMGALMLHGLKPGPLLLSNNPEILPQIVAIFFVGTLLTILVGSVMTRPMVAIFKVRNHILMPIVAALIVLGAFATRSSDFDIWTVIFFGFVGYVLQKVEINPTPLVLGLILGRIIDANMRRVLVIHSGKLIGFFERPISMVLVALIILSLISPFIDAAKKRRKGNEV